MISGKYIAFVEPSVIIREGIISILRRYKLNFHPVFFNSAKDLSDYNNKSNIHLIIVGSVISSKDILLLQKHKNDFKKANWIGLISQKQEREFTALVHDLIYINDEDSIIYKHIDKALLNHDTEVAFENVLSERETDVLKLLVNGKMNKEIAEELFISVHTVITHRKNITQKLGIKSTAAMAIYAVANNIIDLDDSLKLIK